LSDGNYIYYSVRLSLSSGPIKLGLLFYLKMERGPDSKTLHFKYTTYKTENVEGIKNIPVRTFLFSTRYIHTVGQTNNRY